MEKTTQEQEDKKLLKDVKKGVDGELEFVYWDHEKDVEAIRLDDLNQLLAAQARISYAEGVEAERKRVDDLFCEWCMENEFVDESEAQNFRKLLTPPTNEEK